MRRTGWILAWLGAAACSPTSSQQAPAAESTPVAPSAEATTVSTSWSPVVDGLQIQATAPATPATPGSAVTIALRFRNTGAELRRIYLVRSEPFRAMQSSFFVDIGAAGFSMQPEPRPHGIVITEVDFHELPAGKTIDFTQTLQLPPDVAPGTYSVRWEYANQVKQWEGGVQTFDGPTKALFGGGPIPGIWVGEVETTFDVVVAAK